MFDERKTMAQQAKDLGLVLAREASSCSPTTSVAALMQSFGINDYPYQKAQRNSVASQQCTRSVALPCGCRVPLMPGKSNIPLDNQCGCGRWMRKEVIGDDEAYMAWRKA
jgi:hypothetical protein